MSLPGPARLTEVKDATWPAASLRRIGPVLVREGQGGGNRVSAASVAGEWDSADLDRAEEAMRALGQSRLFTLLADDHALDEALAARGYAVKDATAMYAAPIAAIAAAPPPVTAFTIWPPLAAQREVWKAGGIGPERVAVMERAPEPKTTLLGRLNDRPAGTVFVGMHGDCAMIHALEVAVADRRQGLAKHLTQASARWGAANGAAYLTLLTTVENAASNALYASLGMSVVGRYHYRIHPEDMP